MRLKRKVNHPDFEGVHARGFVGIPVVIFDRNKYTRQPTTEEYARVDERRKVIELLGGVFYGDAYDIVPKNKVFSKKDCNNMRDVIKKTFPEYIISSSWNGVGALTFSVSIRKK